MRPDETYTRMLELRRLAAEFYTLSNRAQEIGVTILEAMRELQKVRLAKELLQSVALEEIATQDILDFYLENGLGVSDIKEWREQQASESEMQIGAACPLPTQQQQTKRTVWLDPGQVPGDPTECKD